MYPFQHHHDLSTKAKTFFCSVERKGRASTLLNVLLTLEVLIIQESLFITMRTWKLNLPVLMGRQLENVLETLDKLVMEENYLPE